MTLPTQERLPAAEAGKTAVGNYFVANYPPFAYWTPEFVPTALKAFDRPAPPDTPLGLYVHIPFCRKRCHFCYFKVYTGKNAADVRAYLDLAVRELRFYADRAAVAGRAPKFIYFGGGTPSFLSAQQLKSFARALQHELPWDGAEEITFECEPGTLTETKLETIRALGVTRLSLGIENYDDAVLELNGRAHRSKEIERAYRFARGLDFPQINIDLIAGMIGETDANWSDCVRRTIDLAPDSVTIYQMEIPYNTTIYREMKTGRREAAPVADWETKRRWVREAFAALESAGYVVGSAYTAVRGERRAGFLYRDLLWTGADLLSLGVASFGHINGVHYQNEKDLEPYARALEESRPPIHRALPLNDEERLIREFILQLKLGRLAAAPFARKFGVDVIARFRDPLEGLRDKGYLTFNAETITLTREGLLRVDGLLHNFFLPAHRGERYV